MQIEALSCKTGVANLTIERSLTAARSGEIMRARLRKITYLTANAVAMLGWTWLLADVLGRFLGY